jgi:hypothetical protein
MKGALLPEYLPQWLDEFRKFLEEESGPGLKLRVGQAELSEAKNLANRIRNQFFPRMTPITKAGRA